MHIENGSNIRRMMVCKTKKKQNNLKLMLKFQSKTVGRRCWSKFCQLRFHFLIKTPFWTGFINCSSDNLIKVYPFKIRKRRKINSWKAFEKWWTEYVHTLGAIQTSLLIEFFPILKWRKIPKFLYLVPVFIRFLQKT